MNPLAAALLLALPATEPPREMRGLWVVRTALVSPEAVDRVVDQAAEAGFNALFVQVRGRGDAFYASKLVPRSPLLEKQPAGFDPLARLIERARERRLEVHAWINVLLAASIPWLPAGNIVAQHPDWVMVPKQMALAALAPAAEPLALVKAAARDDPDVEGYYLSPASPAVRQYLVAVVRELVGGYPLDGLHFDFIRYPNRDYDYSKSALRAFAVRQGSKEPLRTALGSPPAYSEFRRESLTSLANALAAAARGERKTLLLSAAVVPDEATASSQKHQDWPTWAARGILDAVVPMTYTPDDRVYREQLGRARVLAGARLLWAGVGAYRLTLDDTIVRIAEARAAGATGVVVFSNESFQPGDLKRLREQAFARDVFSPRATEGSAEAR